MDASDTIISNNIPFHTILSKINIKQTIKIRQDFKPILVD